MQLMAAKKSAAPKSSTDILEVSEGTEGITNGMSTSEIAARMATRSYLTSHAMCSYSGFTSDVMTVTSLDTEMRASADVVAAGDLGMLERMLAKQAITMDTMFASLAERANRQGHLKAMETFLRLALKAQSQCRATAEALALIKNPQPYIRQANIAHGHQQVNQTYAHPSAYQAAAPQALANQPSPSLSEKLAAMMPAGASNSISEPNKLLESNP
jgi:hypothetical protein